VATNSDNCFILFAFLSIRQYLNQITLTLNQLNTMKKETTPTMMGRKRLPVERKKISIGIYISPNDIDLLGGREALKNKMYDYIQTLIDIENDAN